MACEHVPEGILSDGQVYRVGRWVDGDWVPGDMVEVERELALLAEVDARIVLAR